MIESLAQFDMTFAVLGADCRVVPVLESSGCRREPRYRGTSEQWCRGRREVRDK